jgi:hypothetical protein
MWASVAGEQGALLNQSPEEFTRRRLHQIPLGRMERAEDVANVIGFLVSSRSEYMTGQALSVDGGLVRRRRPRAVMVRKRRRVCVVRHRKPPVPLALTLSARA